MASPLLLVDNRIASKPSYGSWKDRDAIQTSGHGSTTSEVKTPQRRGGESVPSQYRAMKKSWRLQKSKIERKETKNRGPNTGSKKAEPAGSERQIKPRGQGFIEAVALFPSTGVVTSEHLPWSTS